MQQIWKYPAVWRALHWLIALLVLALIPVGLWMTSHGEANLWGELTDSLYSWHKAIGFSVLLLMVIRILFKIMLTTPPYPDVLPRKLHLAAKGLHHLLFRPCR